MDLGLKNKRVIITGGTRGIGRAIIEVFAAEGAVVATCARTAKAVDALLTEMNRNDTRCYAEALDVRDKARFVAWFDGAVERLGGLDIAISNVSTRVTTTGEEMWRETFETDLLSHVRFAECALPKLAKGVQPSLTFISSIASVLTNLPPNEDAYGTMKASLISLTGQLASRHGAAGIRVNAVSPGPIFFEGGVWDMIKQHQPQLFTAAERLAALKRHGTAQEVANVVAFLASPAASYVTGANLRIDGGAVKTANF